METEAKKRSGLSKATQQGAAPETGTEPITYLLFPRLRCGSAALVQMAL